MSDRQRKFAIGTLAACVGAVVGVLGYWGVQEARARDEGEYKGSTVTRVQRNEQDIKEIRFELGQMRSVFGKIDRSLVRIETKLGIDDEQMTK